MLLLTYIRRGKRFATEAIRNGIFSKDGPSSTMMVFVVEQHYNYMLFDHVMTSLYALHALHALPLAFMLFLLLL